MHFISKNDRWASYAGPVDSVHGFPENELMFLLSEAGMLEVGNGG
jgi:hypothetical protein